MLRAPHATHLPFTRPEGHRESWAECSTTVGAGAHHPFCHPAGPPRRPPRPPSFEQHDRRPTCRSRRRRRAQIDRQKAIAAVAEHLWGVGHPARHMNYTRASFARTATQAPTSAPLLRSPRPCQPSPPTFSLTPSLACIAAGEGWPAAREGGTYAALTEMSRPIPSVFPVSSLPRVRRR